MKLTRKPNNKPTNILLLNLTLHFNEHKTYLFVLPFYIGR